MEIFKKNQEILYGELKDFYDFLNIIQPYRLYEHPTENEINSTLCSLEEENNVAICKISEIESVKNGDFKFIFLEQFYEDGILLNKEFIINYYEKKYNINLNKERIINLSQRENIMSVIWKYEILGDNITQNLYQEEENPIGFIYNKLYSLSSYPKEKRIFLETILRKLERIFLLTGFKHVASYFKCVEKIIKD